MLVIVQPFAPQPGATTTRLDTDAASDRVPFQGLIAADLRTRKRSVRIANTGANTVFVNFGDSTVTAAEPTPDKAVAAGMPILAGTVEVFEGISATHVAALSPAGASTIYVTPGEGL